MVGFILTGHGQFAPGLASAIAMVAGDQPAFTVVPFEGDQAASYGGDLRAAITAMREECDGVLVFTDLLGGTPFNQSMMIAQDVDNVEVLTGTNLPMVIELLFLRGNATLAELGEQAAQIRQVAVYVRLRGRGYLRRRGRHLMADFGANVLSSSVALLGLLVIMGLIYTIWSQINMKKKQKYFKELHTELKPGQEVLFAGGIYGTVKGIEGEKVQIKVRSGAVVDVSRYAIQEIK